jgi:putative endonuclease
MWYTYILQSEKDGKYYIGSTSNLEQRLYKHNAGATISTKHRRPLKLVYSEGFNTKSEAIKREYKIKSYKGGNAFKKLLSH